LDVNFYDGYVGVIHQQNSQPGLGTYPATERISNGFNLAVS